jgi:arginine N-succinyltransferase
MDEARNSPFWDALAGRFFDMTFPEADEFNAIHGTRFIADLMPRTPIYVSMLADSAKAVIGQPHQTGRAALRMLEEEGFVYDRYIDIFDGGPTVTVPTDRIRTVRESRMERVAEIGDTDGARRMLLAAGRLMDFRACGGSVRRVERKGVAIDAQTAALLEVSVGDKILVIPR